MNKMFIKILSFSIVISLLLAVVGVHFHQHYCEHTGNNVLNISAFEDCSSVKDEVNQSCCHSDESSDCSNSGKSQNSCQKHFQMMDCCHDNIFTITINDVFVKSAAQNILIYRTAPYTNYFNIEKIRFAEYKSKLEQLKLLFKLSQQVVFRIFLKNQFFSSSPDISASH